jgi:hypothetical protein
LAKRWNCTGVCAAANWWGRSSRPEPPSCPGVPEYLSLFRVGALNFEGCNTDVLRMSTLPFVKLERTHLKNNPAVGEAWIQDCIAADPEILGLGALSVIQRESFGNGLEQLVVTRPGSAKSYSLLVQCGSTDEVQLVRAIESWSKASAATAVLVSEEISARYLDLMTTLRGSGRLAAIQMQAMKVGGQMTVIFTNVAGELEAESVAVSPVSELAECVAEETEANEPVAKAGLTSEAAAVLEHCDADFPVPTEFTAITSVQPVDRDYWERSAPEGVEMADRLLAITQAIDPAIELTYRPNHIGMARQGQSADFARFTPETSGLQVALSLEQNSLIELSIAQAGLERLPSDGNEDGYRIRLASADIEAQRAPVARLIQLAYEESRA